MLLIDALHINHSGGKILLDYLIKSVEKLNIEVFYLLDDRISDDHILVNKNKVVFIKANFINRLIFYIKNKNKFQKVFCFGNIPPPIQLNAKTFTFLHQKLFLKIPFEFTFKYKVVLYIKSNIVKYLSKNTNTWIVQTNLMKEALLNSFNITNEIYVHPFYPPLPSHSNKKFNRIKGRFLYVSTYNLHKNFENLLLGFKLFYDQNNCGELHLTLDSNSGEVLLEINKLTSLGYPIINHGFVDREKLLEIYKMSEFVVYPSLSESFGLGLIEGIENGCNVIGADLSYTKAVCVPSLLMNPLSSKSIARAFEKAVLTKTKKTKQLVYNEINNLLNLLK